MKGVLIVLSVVAFLVLAIGGCTFLYGQGVYNGAVTKQETARSALGEVQNQYQRRYDLVPNLVEAVRGFANQELAVFTQVTAERAKVGQINIDASKATPQQITSYMQAQGDFTTALSRLMVVVENYPQLKSDQNFLALQSQLEGTENRIAVARKRYNDAAQNYDTYIRKFPNSFALSVLGGGQFEKIPYFEADKEAQRAPKVDFSNPNK